MIPFLYNSPVTRELLTQYLGNLGLLQKERRNPQPPKKNEPSPIQKRRMNTFINQARALGWMPQLPSHIDAWKWETVPAQLRRLTTEDLALLIQNQAKLLLPIAPKTTCKTLKNNKLVIPMTVGFSKKGELFWGVPSFFDLEKGERIYYVYNENAKKVKVQTQKKDGSEFPLCKPHYEDLSLPAVKRSFTVWPVPFLPPEWANDYEKSAVVQMFGEGALLISEVKSVQVIAPEITPNTREAQEGINVTSEIRDEYLTPTGQTVPELPFDPNNKEPFEWQGLALERWVDHNFRGMIEACTGAGKTRLCILAIERILEEEPETHISIVVPKNALLSQWYDEIKTALEGKVKGITRHSGAHKGPPGQIAIYVINTAATMLPKLRETHADFLTEYPKHFLIVDEAHRSTSSTFRRIYDCSIDFALAVSATFPENVKRYEILEMLVGNLLCVYRYAHALMKGTISPFQLAFLDTSMMPNELEIHEELTEKIIKYARMQDAKDKASLHPEDLIEELLQEEDLSDEEVQETREQLEEFKERAEQDPEYKESMALRMMKILGGARARVSWSAARRLACALDVITAKLDEGKKVIAFHKSVDGASALYNLLQKRGYEIGIYHSAQKDYINDNYLEAFRTNKIKCLLSVEALLEGLNVPDADVGIAVAADQSKIKAVQSLGRVLRIKPGSTELKEYYLIAVRGTKDSVVMSKFTHSLLDKDGKEIIPIQRGVPCVAYPDEEIRNLQREGGLPMPEEIKEMVEDIEQEMIDRPLHHLVEKVVADFEAQLKKRRLRVHIEHPEWALEKRASNR